MAENRTDAGSLERTFDSTLESVDQAEELILGFAGNGGFNEDDLHRIGMAVREAMVNAVVHGNRYNANKTVKFAAVIENDKLIVKIQDQGGGFDSSILPDPLAEENLLRQSGRGLLLIQAFVDEFHMGPGEGGGTAVRLVKNRTS